MDEQLFRPSRPDFIETLVAVIITVSQPRLFRPSRPDFIETLVTPTTFLGSGHCSGLLGRTSLRRRSAGLAWDLETYCSGLLGRTSLRLIVRHGVVYEFGHIVPAF